MTSIGKICAAITTSYAQQKGYHTSYVQNQEATYKGIVGDWGLYQGEDYTFDRGNNTFGYKDDSILGYEINENGYTDPAIFTKQWIG